MSESIPTTVEQVVGNGCLCLDDYKMRGRRDPQCTFCEVKEDVQLLIDHIRELEAENKALRELLLANADAWLEDVPNSAARIDERYTIYLPGEDRFGDQPELGLFDDPGAAVDAAIKRIRGTT